MGRYAPDPGVVFAALAGTFGVESTARRVGLGVGWGVATWVGLAALVMPIRLSAVGYYELYHGAVKEGRDPARIDDLLPWVERIDYDRAHALEGARIRQELEAQGARLQHPDTMLAGVARSLGVPVVTADGGFERVDGLDVENHRELYGE